MPNIQIVNKINGGNQQQNWNQANGYNVFTLRDTDLDMPKFILRVSKIVNGSPVEIGRMTKWPNADGYAHFDIQGLLRGNMGYESDEPDSLGTTPESTIMYLLAAGYLGDSGPVFTDFSPTGLAQDYYIETNGRKPKDVLLWDWTEYATDMVQNIEAGVVTYGAIAGAKPLSDYSEVQNVSVASCVTGDSTVRNFNIGRDEDFTLSFISRSYFSDYDNDVCLGSSGIRVFWFEFVSADGSQRDLVAIDNITGNGGGPWATWATQQSVYIDDEYNVIRVQCGKSNTELAALWEQVYDGTYAFVYVYGSSHKFPIETVLGFFNPPPDCVVDAGETGHWDVDNTQIMTETVKLTYVPAECNDFDHVQVKWKNSFGVDDYFTFTKRDDEVIGIERTTYHKTNESWNGNSFGVNLSNRGKTNITNRFNYSGTLRTKYLTDEEQVYLKNLLMSNEVQAKLNGEWKPIVVTNSQWVKRTYRTDGMFQFELQYELASPEIEQIG